jgi:hypothetical protein
MKTYKKIRTNFRLQMKELARIFIYLEHICPRLFCTASYIKVTIIPLVQLLLQAVFQGFFLRIIREMPLEYFQTLL